MPVDQAIRDLAGSMSIEALPDLAARPANLRLPRDLTSRILQAFRPDRSSACAMAGSIPQE